MKKFLLTLIVTALFSFNSYAALEMTETHRGIELPDGYWALNSMNIDVPGQAAYITIALYASAEAYAESPQKNKLREWDYGYTIGGEDYATIFNPAKSVQEIIGLIFVYIKTHKLPEEDVNHFADAEIVP